MTLTAGLAAACAGIVLGSVLGLAGTNRAARADDEALVFTPAGFDKPGVPATAEGPDVGRLAIIVSDRATGRPTPCRIKVVGPDGNTPMKIGFGAITDGLSNTLAFAERPPTPDLQWGWALRGSPNLDTLIWARYVVPPDTTSIATTDESGAPCPFPMFFQAPKSPPSRCDGYHSWSFHSGGANWALADGSVRFFSYSAGTTTIISMSTRAGGEVVTE